jgi:type IV pilus assembly protein PilW
MRTNKKNAGPFGPTRAQMIGLSLIELMVALAIGTFLIAGAVYVYVESRKNYTVNEILARMQENARYAMTTLEPDVRLANHWGLINNPQMIIGAAGNTPLNLAAYANVDDCGSDFAIDLRRPIDGINQDGYTGNPVPCAATASGGGTRRTSADTIIVRRADETTGAAAANTLQLYTTRQGASSQVFVNGTTPGPMVVDPVYGAQAEIRNLVVRAYYVTNGSSVAGQPSLRRRNLVGGPGVGNPQFLDEEIMPGVEDVQVQFGIDLGADDDGNGTPDDRDLNGLPDRYDGVATRYVNPGDPALAGALVVAVRLWLRVRAATPEPGFQDGKTYDYADVSYTPAGNDRQFRRLLVSRTIQIRNTVNLQT